MIISGDTIQPSVGSNITVPNGLGIQVGSNTNSSLTFDSVGGIVAQQPYWNIVEQQASGVNGHAGATFSAGSWVTRFLNTTIGSNTITGSSLSSNRFTLPAGTYRIFASSPAYQINRYKSKLFNITDSSDTLIGTTEYGWSSGVQPRSIVSGIITITSSKVFEIQSRGETTTSNGLGFGVASSFSVVEIYTQVELWKIG